MSLLPSVGETEREGLWHQAPSWRNLSIIATLLTVAAAGLPLLALSDHTAVAPNAPAAPQPAAVVSSSVAAVVPDVPPISVAEPEAQIGVCTINSPLTPPSRGIGTVVGFDDRRVAVARIQLTQALAEGEIDPAYVNNIRAHLRMDDGQEIIALVPEGEQVKIGDRVAAQGRFRNPNLPCNYVPSLITVDLGPSHPTPVPQ